MTALFNLFSSLPLTTVWGKVKVGLLAGAVAFMVWQGWQMTVLQKDVTKLETVQSSLQAQVQQMSVDYSVLRDNYKNNAKTSEQYVLSLNQLNGKSTELEKTFTALDKKGVETQPTQTGTTPRVYHETSSTQAHTSPVRGNGGGVSSSDAEWRQLLDSTFCSTFPTDNKCSK
jgi:hypothetical protein